MTIVDIALFVEIYESDAVPLRGSKLRGASPRVGGLRRSTCVLDCGATVPQNDFEVPQNDFEVPQNDFEVPQNDFEVPQNDFEVP
ncbi:hypothetical protein LC607_19790 [Nostoc sp. CHAB 5824]|nr:hypothetical protein [Nostoc sp. CHAB 5824]